MNGLTFREALVDYCAWLREETGREYELPTEAHWEKAARGLAGEAGHGYPWGRGWQPERCYHGRHALTAVDAFAAQNDYDCYNLVGNGREWNCSLWGDQLREPGSQYCYPWQDDDRNDLPSQ